MIVQLLIENQERYPAWAYSQVSPQERQLLELTARSLLKLKRDIVGGPEGIETVLHALFVTEGNTTLAVARL